MLKPLELSTNSIRTQELKDMEVIQDITEDLVVLHVLITDWELISKENFKQ